MDWYSLATELRGMILEALAHKENVALYATVSREWQVAIEKQNFRSLNLRVQDIPAFKTLAKEKLGFVRYIWYSIELQEYTCPACNLDETGLTMEANQTIVKDGLQKILCALRRCPSKGDLKLDISVHSLSDSQHQFKYIRFDPANGLASQNVPTLTSHDDPALHPSGPSFPSIAAIDRIFPDIELEDDFWTSIPGIPCVTHLLLRRQTRRRWEPITLSKLLACFPNLQELYYEPWREWGRLNQRTSDIST